MHPFWFFAFLTILVTYLVTATMSFVNGQRLLSELQKRYPELYAANGHPSYLSLAVWGRGFWRPISAGNFFALRRYAETSDDAYIARAEIVRKYQMLSRYASWLLVGSVFVMGYLI